MKIIKFKKVKNNQYEIFLENNTSYVFFEETILFFDLLLKQNIDLNLIDEIQKYNLKYFIYYDGLIILKKRLKTTKEMFNIFLDKEYDISLIKEVIKIYQEQGYLNDANFCKSYINNQINCNVKGPLKIYKELYLKGIEKDIIEKELGIFTNEIIKEKINKIILKEIKINKNKSGIILKNKIISYLYNCGYSYFDINLYIDNYKFILDKNLIKKEYDKLYKKYSKKYSNEELDFIIKQKLFQKGIYYEE